ncbi:MAG: hypothetical protein MUO76_02325, partial [Anaerolineaceae bacterium]|nr:hypothetical protein [Anaerolineaceae bacterium]
MDHIKILKRSWHILWQYKALWVFGIILALTTANWQSSSTASSSGNRSNNGNGGTVSYNFDEDRWEISEKVEEDFQEIEEFFNKTTPETIRNWAITIGIALLCLIFFLYVISRFAHYISETALIQMVNEYEETGEKLSVRQGFRIGWSRTSWRLFLIDLLINVTAAILFILLFTLSLTPLLLIAAEKVIITIIAVVTTIGLFFLIIFFAIIATVVLSLLRYFVKRACVFGKLGVFDSFRQGFAVVKQNLKDVGIMWLIMFAIKLCYGILVIPIGFVFLLSAAVFGGLIAL